MRITPPLTSRIRPRAVTTHLQTDGVRVVTLDDESTGPRSLHAVAAGQVREMLAKRQFHPVYQPIYALDDGRLLAVEALTRFDNERIRSPDIWFEYAARAGMGASLDVAAIERALEGAKDLPPTVALHINVMPVTLLDPRLLRLLDAYPGQKVVVEITEHEVIEDYQRLELVQRELLHRDIEIAVDDAGAGFASLRHIVSLNPAVIKLDVSLTQHVRHHPVRHALAEALIQFVRRTGCRLIAEGIEDRNDLAAWRELGASAAQGYLLGRPGPLPAPQLCSAVVAA